MDLELKIEGSISKIEDLVGIEGVDNYTVGIYLLSEHNEYSEKIEEVEKILKSKDVETTSFIESFLKFNISDPFTHVSTFVHDGIVHYKVYRREDRLEEVLLVIGKLEEDFNESKDEDKLAMLSIIRQFVFDFMGLFT